MKRPLKALLIDFDGTLVDSVSALFSTYCLFLQSFGKVPTQAEFIALNGYTLDEAVACLKAWHEIGYPYEMLVKFYQKLVGQRYLKSKQFVGVTPCLRFAKERGVFLGIVTASSKHWVSPWLHQNGLEDVFDVLITKEMVSCGKPDPEGFLQGIGFCPCPVSQIIAIEDSPHGVAAALHAGLEVWQFTGGEKLVRPIDGVAFRGNWKELFKHLQERL